MIKVKSSISHSTFAIGLNIDLDKLYKKTLVLESTINQKGTSHARVYLLQK